jgi:serine/threonine protein kinase
MIAEKLDSLDQGTLSDFIEGRLPPARFEAVLREIEASPHNQSIIENLARPTRLISLGSESDDDPYGSESACLAVVSNMLVSIPASTPKDEAPLPQVPIETLGPYRVLEQIGLGGMGTVYRAEHVRLKKMVAIKLLPRDKRERTGWLERFNREMQSIAAIDHPNVVRAIDAGDESGWHYLVMDYLDGLDLSQIARRNLELSTGAICHWVYQAALGLEAIHRAGMVHRDIKPSNLFVTREGVLKLLDLGLVLSGESPLEADERLTTVGHLMGTLPYMAREQLGDARQVDYRADLYGLGATAFRLLAGHPPYGNCPNLAQTIQTMASTRCVSLGQRRPNLPASLVSIIDRMLETDPSQRPISALSVADQLKPFCVEQDSMDAIRVALKTTVVSERTATGETIGGPALAVAQPTRGRKPPFIRRFIGWTLAAMVPISFVAGVFLTLQTDRGTIVFETDEPNVSIQVKQEEQVVESLQVLHDKPKTLTLRSGQYRVEVTGLESDGLEISNDTVSVLRGKKQIVKISKRGTSGSPSSQGLAAEPSHSSYFPLQYIQAEEARDALSALVGSEKAARLAIDSRTNSLVVHSSPDMLDQIKKTLQNIDVSKEVYEGKNFENWLRILQTEKESKMVLEAAQAVATLAKSQTQQSVALNSLIDAFHRFPRIGFNLLKHCVTFQEVDILSVLSELIESSNLDDVRPAVSILYSIDGLYLKDESLATKGEFHYKRSLESEAGRKSLVRLEEALRTLQTRIEEKAIGTAEIDGWLDAEVGFARASVRKRLQQSNSEDVQMQNWAKRILAEKKLIAATQGSTRKTQPIEHVKVLGLCSEVLDYRNDPQPVLLLAPSINSSERGRELHVELLNKHIVADPKQFAEVAGELLKKRKVSGNGLSSKGGGGISLSNSVLDVVIQHHPSLTIVLLAVTHHSGIPESQAITIAKRIIAEIDETNECEYLMSLVVTSRIFGSLDDAFEKHPDILQYIFRGIELLPESTQVPRSIAPPTKGRLVNLNELEQGIFRFENGSFVLNPKNQLTDFFLGQIAVQIEKAPSEWVPRMITEYRQATSAIAKRNLLFAAGLNQGQWNKPSWTYTRESGKIVSRKDLMDPLAVALTDDLHAITTKLVEGDESLRSQALEMLKSRFAFANVFYSSSEADDAMLPILRKWSDIPKLRDQLPFRADWLLAKDNGFENVDVDALHRSLFEKKADSNVVVDFVKNFRQSHEREFILRYEPLVVKQLALGRAGRMQDNPYLWYALIAEMRKIGNPEELDLKLLDWYKAVADIESYKTLAIWVQNLLNDTK